MSVPGDPYRAPPAPAPPPRPAIVGPLAGLLVAGGLATFTANKLHTMALLRGDLEGIPTRTMELEGVRRRFTGKGGPKGALYDLSDPSAPDAASYRIQLTVAQEQVLRRGARLTVRCLEEERECYLRDSVFVSDGNVQFDRGLLAIEGIGALVAAWFLARRLRAWRGAVRALRHPPRPPALR